jgi:hypothetical protein
MTFEQLMERHLAGETDLKNETKFIFDTQGEAAALDFARGVDEAAGGASFQLVSNYIQKLKAAASAPKYNEKAAAESELFKQSLQRDKMAKQDNERAMRDAIQEERNAPALPIVEKTKKPLFEGKVLTGGLGLDRDRLKDIDLAAPQEKDNRLYIIAGILLIIAIYYYTKKGK